MDFALDSERSAEHKQHQTQMFLKLLKYTKLSLS